MRLPFIKFYPRDWMADPQLRMVSISARGFWFECICLMHSAKRHGFLETVNGKPYTDEQIARLTGTFIGEIKGIKQELIDHEIPSTEEKTGIWYCRRMVKDEEKREKCGEAGRMGGGNPALKSSDKDIILQIPDTRNHISIKAPFKGDLYRSSPSGDGGASKAFEQFWKAYPRKIGKQAALKSWIRQRGKPPIADVIAAIEEQKRTEQWQKNGGEFIPHPSTWINQGRWEDSTTIDGIKYEAGKI
jgi:hypothetical protein